MDFLKNAWSVLEKNRFTVVAPVLAVILWIYAGISCTPTTESPTRQGVQVNATELQQDFEVWQAQNEIIAKKFTWGAEDIKHQQENLDKAQEALISIASGNVTSWGGLIQMLVSGGLVGLFADNIRKRAVISGLKINGKNSTQG